MNGSTDERTQREIYGQLNRLEARAEYLASLRSEAALRLAELARERDRLQRHQQP
jgi:hypothetical protein